MQGGPHVRAVVVSVDAQSMVEPRRIEEELAVLLDRLDRSEALLQALVAALPAERERATAQTVVALLQTCQHEVQELAQRYHTLAQFAWADPLTGLLNRRGLEEAVAREEGRAARFGTPITVVVLDVDDLKAVNDTHGHTVGDQLLVGLGAALRGRARAVDVVARYGGDEFVLLLLDADHAGAEGLLADVRTRTPAVHLPDGRVVPLQFSAGVALRAEGGSLRAALDLADQRLLAAKRQRRSR